MHWDTNWHSGWFLGMHLVWWIVWIGVAVALWTFVARSGTPPVQRDESPLEVLRRRYAEGALTTAEYEERRAKLTESGAAAH
jgi:putative membrane protein